MSEIKVASIAAFNPYLRPDELSIIVALVNSVAARVMIEFGCNVGRTAKTLLDNVPTLERYIGIDVPYGHVPTLAQQRGETPAMPGLWVADDPRFVLMIRERGSLDLGVQDLEPCDAAFIDGDHSHITVIRDSEIARALVRPGGIIIWHDDGNPAVEVTQALDLLCRQGWPIEHVEESWIAFRRIA
jgi:predicted O-methyltransferase YrrM